MRAIFQKKRKRQKMLKNDKKGKIFENLGKNLRVVIRDSRQDFQFSQLNSLLSWAFSRQDEKIKVNGIINAYVAFK